MRQHAWPITVVNRGSEAGVCDGTLTNSEAMPIPRYDLPAIQIHMCL